MPNDREVPAKRGGPALGSILRWSLYLLGIPSTMLVGLLLADVVAGLLGVWHYYVAAVVLPLVGLGFAWRVAPAAKPVAVMFYLGIGLLLAFVFACPAYLPEGHPDAYQSTYLPFAITSFTGLTFFGIIVIAESMPPVNEY